MNHSEETIRVPRGWVLPAMNLFVSLCLAAGGLWVKNDLRDELKHYVSQDEFAVYRDNHDRIVDQVVKRLQASVDECNRRLDRIEAKVDRIAEKHSAMIPLPGDGMMGLRLIPNQDKMLISTNWP